MVQPVEILFKRLRNGEYAEFLFNEYDPTDLSEANTSSTNQRSSVSIAFFLLNSPIGGSLR